MDPGWGKIIYWAATIIAVLILGVVAVDYVSNARKGYPVISIIPLLLAGIIWLVGWAFRRA
jgi:uncharacterized membrane protein